MQAQGLIEIIDHYIDLADRQTSIWGSTDDLLLAMGEIARSTEEFCGEPSCPPGIIPELRKEVGHVNRVLSDFTACQGTDQALTEYRSRLGVVVADIKRILTR